MSSLHNEEPLTTQQASQHFTLKYVTGENSGFNHSLITGHFDIGCVNFVKIMHSSASLFFDLKPE